jgi:arginine N-succinyltransferase
MVSEFVLRPVEERDLPGLKSLAGSIKDGMTSLPPEDSALEDRITHSLRSFDHRIKSAGGDHYLFVLESIPDRALIGTAGIIARVGGFDPFYTYEIRKERFAHPPLGIDKEMEVLVLKLDHKGPSEVCSLCLKQEYRKAGLAPLLSLSRFLFIASFPKRFDDRIIAELRGYTDENGKSPFWEAIGRHFFHQTFAEADFLSGIGQKDFIRDLMPKHPIYLKVLSQEAQEALGRVHEDAIPAFKILLGQGFEQSREVDIFDSGPLLSAHRSTIKSIGQSKFGTLAETGRLQGPELSIVAHASLDFRACMAPIAELGGGDVAVAPEIAERLRVSPGDRLVYLTRKEPGFRSQDPGEAPNRT